MSEIERQRMDVDIACVGFGPATGGFLTTLSRLMTKEDGSPAVESKTMPGMPPQVICYERADDMGFGVSGVVTKGRAIRQSFPDLDPSQIPMTSEVTGESVAYLLDPHGASRRSTGLKLAEKMIGLLARDFAYELPYLPPFLRKEPGLVTSIGQFTQWVGQNLMASGQVQIWPGTPVREPIIEKDSVVGVRLMDQGTDKQGNPDAGFMAGMDIHAALTVVGDGPVGAVGQKLDDHFGLPDGNHQREWAVGMKMVVELPEGSDLKPGMVYHTLGYPEPEIFGFMYVYPDRTASLGIFVPSWFDSPVRTAYRYLQHWMLHPYIWDKIKGGTLRSWGAKSIQESGRRGEPRLVGDGYARIGEGSGSTNILSGSGVDEAWFSGVLLAEAVFELLEGGHAFSKKNLEKAYESRRRASWLEKEAVVAEKSRDGFQKGMIPGLLGMAFSGLTKGALNISGPIMKPQDRIPTLEEYYKGRIPADEIARIVEECTSKGLSLHDKLMDRAGWPEISLDGKLLISHQDALLLGGKVQAAPGYADHVLFRNPETCADCREKICIEACSGQAISTNPDGGVPLFDREKCVHCGACMWNCSKSDPNDPEKTNIKFSAGSGGLHSAEN